MVYGITIYDGLGYFANLQTPIPRSFYNNGSFYPHMY